MLKNEGIFYLWEGGNILDERQKEIFNQMERLKRGAAIIEGENETFRQDGYSNMLNKYGTKQDNSIAYQYVQDSFVNDLELVRIYESNGLFSKIIDRPAEEAVKRGFDIDYGDESIEEYVESKLDELDIEDNFATAEKWARLYGGSIIVMLCNDGRGLEEPLDVESVTEIEELVVFERSVVQPEYSSMYGLSTDIKTKPWEPEYYTISSVSGYFTVHKSRCLVFKNGRVPEQTTNVLYRYFGVPEYVKIKNALRECITSHENGVKLMERSVQAIYKMKNLANMLGTSDGEDKVLQRLQVIDMARGILNSIAIDTDGEDYDFKNFTMSGVKDVIDSTCNMLSAVTEIPQTILFGRSPAGMNATGDSDMENYYNMVEKIQKQNMKSNSKRIIDLILREGKHKGYISKIPKYKVKFAPLWSLSDLENANIEQIKAGIEQTKAQTTQIYIDSGVLDPSEARKSLADDGYFEINDFEIEDDLDLHTEEGIVESKEFDEQQKYPASAVLVIDNGKILCASRRNGEGLCGPGGKIEVGETEEEAAKRECLEEFNIMPLNLIPIGEYKSQTGSFLDCNIYFTNEYTGTPKADGVEMINERWLSIDELDNESLYPPFEESIKKLLKLLTVENSNATISEQQINDGGPGSGRYPKGSSSSSFSDGEYAKAIKGTKTSDGRIVKSIRKHAFDRAKERDIYPSSIKAALQRAKPTSGNKPNRLVYEHKGTRAIYDTASKELVTAIYLGKGGK